MKGPVALNPESCIVLQQNLEGIFDAIIALNEELSKASPAVRSTDLGDVSGNSERIFELLAAVRDSATRFPAVHSQLKEQYSEADGIMERLRTLFSSGNRQSRVEYELTSRILDEVKGLLLLLVKMLEKADETAVLEVTSRLDRAEAAARQAAAASSQDAHEMLESEIERSHKELHKVMEWRLVQIQEPEKADRFRKACDAVMAAYPQSVKRYPASTSSMQPLYDEYRAAGSYLPPVIFEIDSDHLRAQLLLAKRPYGDRIREHQAKILDLFADMDDVVAKGAAPTEVARVTKGVVSHVKAERAIAKELVDDPMFAEKGAQFLAIADELQPMPYATSAKGVAKGDSPEDLLRRAKAIADAIERLLRLVEGGDDDDKDSLLLAISGVASAIAALANTAKDSTAA
jgi:hypothetical protein